ncbi:endo-alpha-N-acetylgalactosaminidase family protein [Shivajiella indica]|uniref:Endo-alpha-N-acetylgalactosaminidase family protein n=1 Tax=Shivajiella indica TaxID=872115 RepID=A0ABW5BBS2_9BACT
MVQVEAENKLNQSSIGDTIFAEKIKLKKIINWSHAYHQTLTMKISLAGDAYTGNQKRYDVGPGEVKLNCEQALDVIRRVDNITLGIPKIIYLVGWQYNGHDSKYPAWFEGNERIKRPQDANALESLKWLMNEARNYNTTVSLHINMSDAYEDSPLWNVYLQNDIISKNKDGSLRLGRWGYPISYAQEWETGFAQKRIDSLCNLLPLKEAGTVHIDAFYTDSPFFQQEPISPYLNFTIDDEAEAQRKIFIYWDSKGIDVTSEHIFLSREKFYEFNFVPNWRRAAFEGYQPMAWHLYQTSPELYMRWPASYYSGGVEFNSDYGKLFGTSMHGQKIISQDAKVLPGFSSQFFSNTAIWYFLNRLDRLYYVKGDNYQLVQFSDNVRTFLSEEKYIVTKGDMILMEDTNVFVPALWLEKASIVAYSLDGYQDREWLLPDNWKKIDKVNIYKITMEGNELIEKGRETKNGRLRLSLEKDMAVLITPS